MSMWIISRGVVLLILLMLGISFKFGISGLLHQVITTIADRIRDKDTSQSKQNLQSSSMTFIHKTLIIPSVLDSCFNSFTVCEVKRIQTHGNTTMVSVQVKTQKIQAGVQVQDQEYSEDIFSFGSAFKDFIMLYLYLIGTFKDTEDPSWSTSFKTRSTQKTSLALEALWKTIFVLYLYLIETLRSKLEYKFQDKEYSEDIFSSGSALEDFICVVFVPDRNIDFREEQWAVLSRKKECKDQQIRRIHQLDTTYQPFHSEQRIDLYSAVGEWFKKDCIGSVTTWEDLVEKFIQKFYQPSDDNEEIEVEE
ncbi:hypothetical protein Tco_0418955 [Tanacetum coccineum]